MPKVSVNLVTWNGLKYLADCLESIYQQTFQDFSLIVIDNGSTDGTVEFIKTKYPQAAVIQNFKNLGFARAHNQAIEYSNTDYVLLINQDIILNSDYLEQLIKTVETDSKIGSLGGKLLKIKTSQDDLNQKIKTSLIDSAGLTIFKNRRVIDRGSGQEDQGQYNQPEEIFGFSGALVLYRRQALNDIKLDHPGKKISEYLDQDFFSYKEDIDLAWRLQLAGWKSVYLPSAVAYHYRTASQAENPGWQAIRINRRDKSNFVNQLSYKNHLLLLFKNEALANFLKFSPQIVSYELKKFFYLLIFEPANWYRSLKKFFKQLPRILSKRKIYQEKIRLNSGQLNRWFI
ncbi:MAG TPA: glycosyltransferase family 2 protein [Patescibacteria group bacterium]